MSTAPRTGQTPSAKTISKLSKAMGDPTKTFYGRSLARAPDGGAPADYYKGWRFLPADVLMPKGSKTLDGSPADGYTLHEIMKDQTHVTINPQGHSSSQLEAWKGKPTEEELAEGYKRPLKRTSSGMRVVQALKDLHNSNGDNPKAQKVIDDAYHQLVLAPQIKAQEEQLAKQREAKQLEYATLQMRVIELEKKQTPKRPTPTPAVTSSLPIIPIIIIAVIVGIFLLRRRA